MASVQGGSRGRATGRRTLADPTVHEPRPGGESQSCSSGVRSGSWEEAAILPPQRGSGEIPGGALEKALRLVVLEGN